MRIFDISEAEHFCTALPAHVPGVGQSLAALHNTLGRTLLVEGTTYFDAHRVSLLNSVERWILFGVSDYRRALDMFVASNAPWAHVTLYYSAFFAANAILGMFGRLGTYRAVGGRRERRANIPDVSCAQEVQVAFWVPRKPPDFSGISITKLATQSGHWRQPELQAEPCQSKAIAVG